jgi:hypothetical protein
LRCCAHGAASKIGRRRDERIAAQPGEVITDNTHTTRLDSLLPHHLVGRLYLLAGILSLELMVRWPLAAHPDLTQAATVPAIVAYALFLGLGQSRIREIKGNLRIGWALFWAHSVCYSAYAAGTGLTRCFFSDWDAFTWRRWFCWGWRGYPRGHGRRCFAVRVLWGRGHARAGWRRGWRARRFLRFGIGRQAGRGGGCKG